MANCVLCGKKIGMFDQINLDFHGTQQPLCSDCDKRLQNAPPQEREALNQQILDSPHLLEADTVRANVYTGKPCPACGATLECRLRNFSIGQDGYGGLSSLGLPSYAVDLFACPKCGKVELYTARFAAQPPVEEESVTCPVCGTRHSPLIGCPSCAVQAAQSGRISASPKETSPRGRNKVTPPWEK